jgi:hypothetical protein
MYRERVLHRLVMTVVADLGITVISTLPRFPTHSDRSKARHDELIASVVHSLDQLVEEEDGLAGELELGPVQIAVRS